VLLGNIPLNNHYIVGAIVVSNRKLHGLDQLIDVGSQLPL
jgi:hypothetical protein